MTALILAVGVSLSGAPARADTAMGSISGTVTSVAGVDLSKSAVAAVSASDGAVWGSFPTAADGSYKISYLPAGSYLIEVRGGNSGGYNTWYGGSIRELAVPVSLAPGQAVTGIDVKMPLGGTISGKIAVPPGFTFEKISVHIYGEQSGLSKSFSWVDANGGYLIKGVAPGDYSVYFYPQNPDLLPLEYGRDWSQPPTTIRVTGTEAVTGIDVVLPRASVIEGKLQIPEGATLEGLTVTARSAENSVRGRGTIGPDSSFRITALLPGSYRIKVSAGATGMVDQWFSDGTLGGSATNVVVGPEETVGGHTLTLSKAPEFLDMADGDQFSQDIQWLAARGVTQGFPDNTYRPLETIQRDAMAAFLYRAAGRPHYVPPAQSPFRDVHPSTQFYKEIMWLSSTGITRGYDDGTFRPGNAVNRDAMAAFLRRFANNVSCVRPQEEIPVFTDNPRNGQFAEDIHWLSCFGISTGFPDGTFRPTEPVRRDAMAAFLNRWSAKAVVVSGLT